LGWVGGGGGRKDTQWGVSLCKPFAFLSKSTRRKQGFSQGRGHPIPEGRGRVPPSSHPGAGHQPSPRSADPSLDPSSHSKREFKTGPSGEGDQPASILAAQPWTPPSFCGSSRKVLVGSLGVVVEQVGRFGSPPRAQRPQMCHIPAALPLCKGACLPPLGKHVPHVAESRSLPHPFSFSFCQFC